MNLKKLNSFIDTEHFKLEDIRTACKLISKNCFMTSIDLKEAYFSVPIADNYKKYLRFTFNGHLFEFNALPYGLCTAPFVFTKLLKPVCTYLRNNNIIMTCYLDDSLYFHKSKRKCEENVKFAVNLLQGLGFVINVEKSHLKPSQSCQYLGFNLESTNLALSIPQQKQIAIVDKIKTYLVKTQCQIREFSQLLGTLSSICPAIPYGWVYTKILEREKYLALLQSKDDYDVIMPLKSIVHPELDWWSKNLHKCNPIKQHNFKTEILTDASTTGWGAVCGSSKTSGSWSDLEKNYHINYLELKAAFFGLQCFAKDLHDCEVLLRVDNTTAVAYINKMGGVQFTHLNSITRDIWQWCEERNIWIYTSYINTKDNYEADRESRKINIEWELSQRAYSKIVNRFGVPNIDLFASRINSKCEKFVSWKCDPEAFQVDAFTLNWSNYFFYAFPPFSLILKCLHKIKINKATGILVFPYWPSQPWFPLLNSLLIKELLIFEPNIKLLTSPFRGSHPLHQQLTLAAGLLSARHT